MPQGHLWTTADVARAFGVAASTVKRWTEEGELEAARTPGRHRRYTLAALHVFARIRRIAANLPPLVGRETIAPPHVALINALRRRDAAEIQRLVTPPMPDLAARAAYFDHVIPAVLRAVDDDEVPRVMHMLAESVDALRPATPVSRNLVLLACPPGERHDFPLHLVRLIFEWRGWRSECAGADVPWRVLAATAERLRPRVIALSARSGEPFRYTDFGRLAERAAQLGGRVVVGGEWARGGAAWNRSVERFRTLHGLAKWLE